MALPKTITKKSLYLAKPKILSFLSIRYHLKSFLSIIDILISDFSFFLLRLPSRYDELKEAISIKEQNLQLDILKEHGVQSADESKNAFDGY